VYLAQDAKHGFVALKTVDSQRMGVVSWAKERHGDK
jgi:hypothetical protein